MRGAVQPIHSLHPTTRPTGPVQSPAPGCDAAQGSRAISVRPGSAPNIVLFYNRRRGDRKSTRLNSSHVAISYAVFCLKKKKKKNKTPPQRKTVKRSVASIKQRRS